jgi:N-sulfoglucosamine sulfohydrolase
MISVPKAFTPAASPGVRDELVTLIDLAPTVLALAGVPVPAHMHGRALLGPRAAPAPAYVFAARDRMDIEYDMIRSARNASYLYIRNFAPELPYAGHITYRNQSAIMQEWLGLHAAGKLSGPPALWMRNRRPAEELYDVRADPHQVRDLAADPAYAATLGGMRRAVVEWMTRIDDQGLITEAEMIDRMWPGGVQPKTAQPYVVPRRSAESPARLKSMRIDAPTEVVIYVPTQGASIGYTSDEGSNPRWQLYDGPILVDSPMTLRAKAIRYGYAESEEARIVFTK